MKTEEIARRANLDKRYVGRVYERDGMYSFDNTGNELEGNPLVSYRGPTTKAVRRTFADAGFLPSDNKQVFTILWGNPQTREFMQHLSPGQLVPHIAGQYCITRKDSLATTLEDACRKNQIFCIAPKSFSLPEALSQYQLYSKKHPGYYMVKLANAARGEGVQLIHSAQSFKVRNAVVQEYIKNPLLINGRKFDIRLYVVVTMVEPLTAYVYHEGLGRFATTEYVPPQQGNIKDATIHLTNYSVNKETGEEIGDYKWRFTDVLDYIDKHHPNKKATPMYTSTNATETPREIAYQNILHVIRLTLIAAEPKLVSESNMLLLNTFPRRQFGFFGFDVMLRDDLTASIIEVNVNPSTATEHQIDVEIKYPMLRDMLQLVCVPCTLAKNGRKVSNPTMCSVEAPASSKAVCAEIFKLRPGEKKFGAYKDQKPNGTICYSSLSRYERMVIDQLKTEGDRCGDFTRILPCRDYNQYFLAPRYLNDLVVQNVERE